MTNSDETLEASPGPRATRLEQWALFAEIAGAVAVVLSVAYPKPGGLVIYTQY